MPYPHRTEIATRQFQQLVRYLVRDQHRRPPAAPGAVQVPGYFPRAPLLPPPVVVRVPHPKKK